MRDTPGAAVYIRPHPDSLPQCGVTEGLARVLGGSRDLYVALGAYSVRISRVRELEGSGAILCEQRGVPVLVHESEIAEVVGLVDSCEPEDGVTLRFCLRCLRFYVAGRPCPDCGESRWTDRLPHLDGGSK